jgi:hypothetical protein
MTHNENLDVLRIEQTWISDVSNILLIQVHGGVIWAIKFGSTINGDLVSVVSFG